MKNYKLYILVFFILFLGRVISSAAQERNFSEQVIGWGTINLNDPLLTQTGIRYIPDFKSKSKLSDKLNIKTHLALNTYVNSIFSEDHKTEIDYDLKPYRLLVGLSGNQLILELAYRKLILVLLRFYVH